MARTFNGGSSNYFSTTLQYNLPTNCTILFRAKTSVGGSELNVMGRRGAGTGWAVRRPASDNLRLTYFGVADSDSASGGMPADSTWHSYAIRKVGTGITFFRDSNTPGGTATATPVTEASIPLFVGTYNNNNVPGAMWDGGAICDLTLFSTNISDANLAAYMAGTPPTSYSTSLDHFWPMDETSGNCADSVGGVTLTEQGTVGSEAHPTFGGGGGLSLPIVHHYNARLRA